VDDKEQRIRDRAYQIWKAEGQPEGREAEHWERARRELDESAAAQSGKGDAADDAAGKAPTAGPKNELVQPASGEAARTPSAKPGRKASVNSARR